MQVQTEPHDPQVDGPPPGPAAPGPHPARLAAQALALVVLSTVGGLVFWSVAPVAVGWRADVILSGSMAPAILPGDVVVGRPTDGHQVDAGELIVFEDPAAPGRTVLHRVVRRQEDGALVTRGDANAADDSTPVPPEAVVASPRLRVPSVGLAAVWLQQGERHRLGILGVALAVCAAPLLVGDRPPRQLRRRR
jgi:signal peptidase I